MKIFMIIALMLLGSSSYAQRRPNVHKQPEGYPNVCINSKQNSPPSPRYSAYRAKSRKQSIKASNKRARKSERERRKWLRQHS
jgi:hypothetical protein